MKKHTLIGVVVSMALVLVASAVVLVGLGRAPLWDYDEASYAQITHGMLAHQAWISQQYFHGPFLEKPPLYAWLAAGSARMFGETEFALRLPSALAAVALVAATIALTFVLTESVLAAVFAGCVLLGLSPLFEAARQVRIDVLVTLWITLAAWAAGQGVRKKRYFLLYGILLGCAVLTKGVIAFFALAALPLLLWWYGALRLLRTREVWGGMALALLIALPWHIIEFVTYGKRFWQDYVVFNITSRVRSDLFELAPTSNRDYIWYLAHFALPWTQVLALSVVPLLVWWREVPARMRAAIGFGLSMVTLVLCVFFASATKAPTYLMPLYPFAALVLGSMFAVVYARVRGGVRVIFWALGGLLFVLGVGATVYNSHHLNTRYFGVADALAQEEYAIAPYVAQHTEGRWLVFGGYRELGAIMYYAHRYDPEDLTSTSTLQVGDLVLMYQAKRSAFFGQYPVSTVALFDGEQLTLLEVVSED